LKYLKIFEEFKTGKFSTEDLQQLVSQGKKIYASVIKGMPDSDKDKALEIVDIDSDTGEVTVLYDNEIKYVDIEDIEDIER
jgi:hypothetical protein